MRAHLSIRSVLAPARGGMLAGCMLAGVMLLTGCAAGFDWQSRSGALAAYRHAHRRDVGTRFVKASDLEGLLSRLRTSNLVWLGDHHRHLRLHDHHLQLLEYLHAQQRPLCLLLEAVGTQDQQDVDAYLAGQISEPALRQRIGDRNAGSWLLDADVDTRYYRQLLQFARQTRARVVALEPIPRKPLADRDVHMAATIQRTATDYPDHRIVVVVGSSHLLGTGRLIDRTGLGGVAFGAVTNARLQRARKRFPAATEFLQSSGGLWFFADLL